MTILFKKENCDIIELGAGTGVVSLTLAALRSADASLSEYPARILTTDLPSSMEVMEHNITQNDSLFTTRVPVALILDWDEGLPPQVLDVGSRGGFDMIVMADVTYNTSSFPALVNTLSALLALSPKSTTSDASESTADESEITKTARNANAEAPLILLAYKQRDPAERELWELLREKTSVQLVQVNALPGTGGEAVEIWVGQAT